LTQWDYYQGTFLVGMQTLGKVIVIIIIKQENDYSDVRQL